MANWIKGAVKRPGRFSAKAKAARMPVHEYAEYHKHDKGLLGQEARFAALMEKQAAKRRRGR